MIVYECDQCGKQLSGSGPFATARPKEWLDVTISVNPTPNKASEVSFFNFCSQGCCAAFLKEKGIKHG